MTSGISCKSLRGVFCNYFSVHGIILCLVHVLSSCTNDYVDPEFETYVNKFKTEAQARNVELDWNVTIKFGEIEPRLAAKCSRNVFGYRTITIDEYRWGLISENEKLFLIFHELGHCILNRKHDNKTFPTGQCRSIMNNSMVVNMKCSTDMYSENWVNYYFDELFKLARNSPLKKKELPCDSIILTKGNRMHYIDEMTSRGFVDSIQALNELENVNIIIEYENLNYPGKIHLFKWNGIILSYDNYRSDLLLYSNHKDQERIYYGVKAILDLSRVNIRIAKIGEVVHYYINDQLLHTMGFDEFQLSNEIATHQSPGKMEYRIEICI